MNPSNVCTVWNVNKSELKLCEKVCGSWLTLPNSSWVVALTPHHTDSRIPSIPSNETKLNFYSIKKSFNTLIIFPFLIFFSPFLFFCFIFSTFHINIFRRGKINLKSSLIIIIVIILPAFEKCKHSVFFFAGYYFLMYFEGWTLICFLFVFFSASFMSNFSVNFSMNIFFAIFQKTEAIKTISFLECN